MKGQTVNFEVKMSTIAITVDTWSIIRERNRYIFPQVKRSTNQVSKIEVMDMKQTSEIIRGPNFTKHLESAAGPSGEESWWIA